MFIAPEDPDLYVDGFLTVYWQGDHERCSEHLMGEFIAAVEIAEASRLWVAMGEYADHKWGYSHLAQHFAFKTGVSVPYDHEVESELMTFLGKAARKIGSEALISIVKAGTGIP